MAHAGRADRRRADRPGGAQTSGPDPRKFVKAWKRGGSSTTDVLSPDWSFFDVAATPLEDVRRSYGIDDLQLRYRASGPEWHTTAEADLVAV